MTSKISNLQALSQIPMIIWQIMAKINKKNEDIFLVGGAVRNLLLNKPLDDNFDLTTSATPEKIQSLFPESFYNNKYGMVGIPVWKDKKNRYQLEKLETKPSLIVEITTYRSEYGYSDKRRPDKVVWGKSLEEDLKRRDFTINAMVLGWFKNKMPKSLELDKIIQTISFIDPFNGQQDLEKKIIRAIGQAEVRFSEDALRLLRAVRFASQLGFTIEPKTKAAIKKKSSLISYVSAERIRQEIFKILVADQADYGFRLLDELNLLSYILPELEKSKKVILSKHHKYDLWEHSLLSLKFCPEKDPITRLAALIHDLGKIETWAIICQSCQTTFKVDYHQPNFICPNCGFKNDPHKSGIFYNHEVVSAKIAKKIAQNWKLDKNSAEKLYKLVRWHQFSVDENLSDKAIRRFIKRVGKENIPSILALRIGDRLGSGVNKAISWRMEKFIQRLTEVQKQPFSIQDLKVNGHDVMNILNLPPSPKVGKILQELFDLVVNHSLANERQVLLKAIKERFSEKRQ